ncbi:MAG: hypothetical protein JEZ04_14505 [Spirochaetales bacterium]|nr:hypothetical protein [Spirochaetales bacterium]
MYATDKEIGQIAVIVAHPDDETLWAGGTLLSSSFENCFILSLCRREDPDRAARFYRVLTELGASGTMADLDDGPQQVFLPESLIANTIIDNLPIRMYDRIYTHSPLGEYTRHKRHEETGRAVLMLWLAGLLQTKEILLFAYDDGGHAHLPKPIKNANIKVNLPEEIWEEKYHLITDIYNFNKDSFEAKTTPATEAFWQVKTHDEARQWLKRKRSE